MLRPPQARMHQNHRKMLTVTDDARESTYQGFFGFGFGRTAKLDGRVLFKHL